MKFLIVFVALFALAAAAPPRGSDATVVHQESDVGPENFKYGLELSDGRTANAEGHLENSGSEDEAIAVKGSYRFVGDDGVTYQIDYIADRNGYQPSGAHIPHA